MPVVSSRLAVLSLAALAALSAACSAPATDTPKAPASLTDVATASLARIDGDLKVPGLKAPVEIIRDQQGIPHLSLIHILSLRLDAARLTFDRAFIRAALVRTGGRRTRAARELGVSRQGLAKLMARLELEPGDDSAARPSDAEHAG